MKTLILRTIYHTNVWEYPRDHCVYETTQLLNMILVWQNNYLQLKTSEINFALGIYAEKYFEKSIHGKIPFNGSSNEEIISLIKPISLEGLDSFQNVTGLEENRPYTRLSYNVIGKLWNNADRNKMLSIDYRLTSAKIQELEKKGIPTQTNFNYPLSFVLDTDIVFSILSEYKYD